VRADSTNPNNELNEQLAATSTYGDERIRGERNMTNAGPEKRQQNNEEDLPVVLPHGTSGQSEDWSHVVEQLTKQ
jgi:hypothetical protein